ERTLSHPLLTAPICRRLLRLAGPTTAVMVVQTFVAIAETFIFGRLGTEALAGFALVFPFMMMMTMMAAGGMGGGAAGAMGRAGGARPRPACPGAGRGAGAAVHPAGVDRRPRPLPPAGRRGPLAHQRARLLPR